MISGKVFDEITKKEQHQRKLKEQVESQRQLQKQMEQLQQIKEMQKIVLSERKRVIDGLQNQMLRMKQDGSRVEVDGHASVKHLEYLQASAVLNQYQITT